jgi:pimeloyl-ACP methyl ester carboxylesterase
MPEAVSSDGLRISYESFGCGVPVLLLHPANATRRAWSDLGWVDAIASLGHRPVVLDSRGFGESDRVSGPDHLRPETSTLDVTAVMDALGIDRAHLCGFSLGAAQALRFVLDQPTRVESLVLGGLALGPLAQVGLHLSPTAEVARKEALRQLERPLLKASGEARAYFVAVQALISEAPLSSISPCEVRAPILGLSGAADPYDPSVLYRVLLAGGAPIEIESIPEAGHGSCFTHPRFRERATQFVAAQAGRVTKRCS